MSSFQEAEDESLDIVMGSYAPRPPGTYIASPPPAVGMMTRMKERFKNETLSEIGPRSPWTAHLGLFAGHGLRAGNTTTQPSI